MANMKSKVILVSVVVIALIVIYCWMYFYSSPESVLYRYKDQTRSHSFIIYNDNSAEELKEAYNSLYCNISFGSELNVMRTSSNISENVLSFGFINVDTDFISVDDDEFESNGIYLIKDTLVEVNNGKKIGMFSFYIGNEIDDNLKHRHLKLRDSILTTLNQ